MLLAIDVGNTNITIGVFEGETLKCTYRMTTKNDRTSDEFGIAIRMTLEWNGIKTEDIEAVCICTVVPKGLHSLSSGIKKYFKLNPIIIGPGIKTGIKTVTEDPKQIGADRIVDAAGAFELYGGPVLVLDFGTATTYDLISEDAAFLAGVTAPGIRISAKALWEDAAKLPEIAIEKPDSILAENTVTSMQAGLVFGQIGQTEYIVKRMIEESKYDKVKVVATGGLGRLISENTDCIDLYNPDLTLIGIQKIYEKQK
ncbi:MAG: type III pantothenate kinase [Lachnospiraceae bacterium]|nr:type III pantothenate kinase [Lachnospiraceae bacterium]